MKNDNRKRNGLLTASAIFYILFALDLIVNTALAHILVNIVFHCYDLFGYRVYMRKGEQRKVKLDHN